MSRKTSLALATMVLMVCAAQAEVVTSKNGWCENMDCIGRAVQRCQVTLKSYQSQYPDANIYFIYGAAPAESEQGISTRAKNRQVGFRYMWKYSDEYNAMQYLRGWIKRNMEMGNPMPKLYVIRTNKIEEISLPK
jgi:hypothetical protein